MSNLTEMKSILDRHNRGQEGANVGVTPPSAGNYHTIGGTSDSPFDSNKDHMVDLLTTDVLSENSGVTYQSSPNKSQFQDLDGAKGPIFGDAGGEGKKLGGKDLHEAMLTQAYTNNGVTVGPSPGPSGNSIFQDLDGGLPNHANYKAGKGPADGHY